MRPEIELLPIRPLESITVARSEFMYREYDYAAPACGDDRLRHEYMAFVRTARMMLLDAAGGGLAPMSKYHDEVRKER